ncbi:N-acetylmuramoyl-L-alanine amidase [Candidatus Amarolinea dominans]|uniref:N-acetylmuramoyl-L-alanine amidase n=1 Tax=Candidatus Amarolinea dominans TaxID=3140696 RepID=UPI001D5DE03B|nr:N-acetylmuramoyl-L-alanine amidase [Anaerolineae bacterium]
MSFDQAVGGAMALVIPAILFVIYESQPKRHMNNSLLNRSRLLAGRTTLVVGVIVCVVRIMLSHGLPNVSAQSADPLVILRQGHGWAASVSGPIDSGAVRRDLIEKDINLDVAHLTRARLARCPVTVLLTRTGDDSAHTLEDVDEIVNFYRPALGVSIHSNASGDPAISGTEAWYTVNGVSGNDAQRQQLVICWQPGCRRPGAQ